MLTPEEVQRIIDYEIIVDAYTEEEVSMDWYYTFEERLSFPFTATAQLKKKNGSKESKRVSIIGLHSKEDGFLSHDFQLDMQLEEYVLPVSYSQLSDIEADEGTMDMFQIWNFWINR